VLALVGDRFNGNRVAAPRSPETSLSLAKAFSETPREWGLMCPATGLALGSRQLLRSPRRLTGAAASLSHL
jgi:hypothetical protein